MTVTGYLIILGVVAAAAGAVLFYHCRTKRILQNLNQMLECAMQGSFVEKQFDESICSALETKFAHYLSASAISGRNLRIEKDNIKALIGDISHQTKTPIANVLLYTQLLEEQSLSAESHGYVEELEKQAKKLQTLIDALVKISRLETGVVSLHPIRSQLDTVIQSAVSQMALKAEKKEISLTAEPVDAEAVFDPKWTEETIVNLLDNAIKYTPNGGRVIVDVMEYQLFSCIRVTDTGSGICEEEQPKIFQRFYRGLQHHMEEGVGIGLYLVRQIAQGQGGYIRVQSEKGQGAAFLFYIPRE